MKHLLESITQIIRKPSLVGMGTVLVLAGLVSGCATGRTDFRVLHRPDAPPEALAAAAGAGAETAQFAGGEAVPVSAVADVIPATYTVKSGECLWRICDRILGDPEKYRLVARTNHISRPYFIYPGQMLTLPPPAAPAKTNPESAAVTPATAAEEGGAPLEASRAKSRPLSKANAAILDPDPAAPVGNFPVRPNACFGPGEQLGFSVEYFGLAAGYATLTVQEGPKLHNRPTYHLLAEARTHPAFEWFYKVRDKIESYFDQQGLFPWRYEKHLREGGYHSDDDMSYDQYHHRVIKDQGKTIVPAPLLTQDVLSEFYYFRTLPLKVGDDVKIPVVADDGKTYDLRVSVLRRERVTVPAGSFNCLVVEPYLNFEGLFQHKGKLHIWITDDARRVPVLIKSQILIGSICIVLRDAVVVEP